MPGNEWFEQVVEEATDLVVAFHPDGEIVYINRAGSAGLPWRWARPGSDCAAQR